MRRWRCVGIFVKWKETKTNGCTYCDKHWTFWCGGGVGSNGDICLGDGWSSNLGTYIDLVFLWILFFLWDVWDSWIEWECEVEVDDWDFCDVDASFGLISFFLGTQTILYLYFSFEGMVLYWFLDVLGFGLLKGIRTFRIFEFMCRGIQIFILESLGFGGMSGSFMFRQCVHWLVIIKIYRGFMDEWIRGLDNGDIRCWK